MIDTTNPFDGPVAPTDEQASLDEMDEASAAAEIAAENAWLHAAEYDPEAAAFEEYENRMGKQSFEDAMAEARAIEAAAPVHPSELAPKPGDAAAARESVPSAASGREATEPQMKYIRGLMVQRLTASEREAAEARLGRGPLDMYQASRWITRLLDKPLQPIARAKAMDNDSDVPAGRYAIQAAGDTVKFYKVDRPTEGKWAGYTFLSAQASDELHPIKHREIKQTILRMIAVDPEAASKRYGQEIGECGVCGRTLTDETSRAAGIGPICAGKRGW